MTIIMWEGVGGLLFFLAMAVLAIYFYGRYCRDLGYEEGRGDQYAALGSLAEMAELAAADDRAETRAPGEPRPGRHERTQPHTGNDQAARTRSTEDSPAAYTRQQPPWYREIPGPGRIQPGRDSGTGTITFPRVQLTDATTGEIRAIGDANVAAIEAALP